MGPDPAKIAWVMGELQRTLNAAHRSEQPSAFRAESAEILTHDPYVSLASVTLSWSREYAERTEALVILRALRHIARRRSGSPRAR